MLQFHTIPTLFLAKIPLILQHVLVVADILFVSSHDLCKVFLHISSPKIGGIILYIPSVSNYTHLFIMCIYICIYSYITICIYIYNISGTNSLAPSPYPILRSFLRPSFSSHVRITLTASEDQDVIVAAEQTWIVVETTNDRPSIVATQGSFEAGCSLESRLEVKLLKVSCEPCWLMMNFVFFFKKT